MEAEGNSPKLYNYYTCTSLPFSPNNGSIPLYYLSTPRGVMKINENTRILWFAQSIALLEKLTRCEIFG